MARGRLSRRGSGRGLARDTRWEGAFFTATAEAPLAAPANSVTVTTEWVRAPAGVGEPGAVAGVATPEDWTLMKLHRWGGIMAIIGGQVGVASAMLRVHVGVIAWDNIDHLPPGNNPSPFLDFADQWVYRRVEHWFIMAGTYTVSAEAAAGEGGNPFWSETRARRKLPDDTGLLWVMDVQNDFNDDVSLAYEESYLGVFKTTNMKRK